MSVVFSCIIPCSQKDLYSQNLRDLIASIKEQEFPQDQIEILTITEGDSEQAKAIGIRQAKGEICAMFCADNEITSRNLFPNVYKHIKMGASAVFTKRYDYRKSDKSLNRYFALIGGNDPICYALGKNDRASWVDELNVFSDYPASYGCNGFFYRSDLIKATDLDHYYPMDNAMQVKGDFIPLDCAWIWHKTSDNLFTFLKKRYRYARNLYCDRQDRRWRILDMGEDYYRLALFILATVTVLPALWLSIRGFRHIKDWAWFWHWPVSFGFLITYTILVIRNLFKHGRLFQCSAPSLSRPLAEAKH